ncbi:MAG TPA: glutamate--cysteine ligase [Acidimicrobiales bacterium]|nr:glutamate--cysteine ligase [Acidimicrobiales bacterium]
MFTVGVEEEYHLVDAETMAMRSMAAVVDAARDSMDDASAEISTAQLEVATPVCTTLDEVRGELVRLRAQAGAVAARHGCRILAMATHPFATWDDQELSAGARYVGLFERWGVLALQQLITGCHVHVAVDDPDVLIGVLDRVRPWLPTLVALTASSPFWEGTDTGYASYRTMWFDRWPTAGLPGPLGSRQVFDELVTSMVATGAIDDATHLYWDARPSVRYPTLEFRCGDVSPSIDDAVLYAALARSLTRTLVAEVVAGAAPPDVRPEVLRVARWRAARHGLSEQLVDPATWQLAPAPTVVDRLLARLRPDLEAHGEWDEVDGRVRQVVAEGGAAARYRALMARTGDLTEVTRAAVAETAQATAGS